MASEILFFSTLSSTPKTSIPDRELPVRVITPVSGADSLREILVSLVRDFPAARQLAWRLFLRDTRAQYRQSILGFVWLFLPPIANTGVWIFLNSQNIITVDTGNVSYPLFVLTGTVLWGAFSAALSGSIGVVGEAAGMISKLNFPHEALLLSAFLKVSLNTLIQSLLLIPAFFFLSVTPDFGIAWLPVGLLFLILLGFAIGVFLIPLGTLYTDVGRGVQLALRFAFFLTPVVYPIPDTGIGRWLATVNPVSPLLVTTRGFMLGGEPYEWLTALVVAVASIVLLCFGVLIYKLAMPRLIERMSS